MYDIAIIGAGPAGSTLARLLSPRYRVLLADRRRLDLPPSAGLPGKVCGGLLAPAAQAELARQGLGVPSHVVAGPQLFAVRTIDLPANLERIYQRFYVNIDRELFDRWLVSLVPAGVESVFGWSLGAIERDPDGSFLRFRTSEGGSAGVRARLVVGADGASSLVRRLAFPDSPAAPRYTSIQATFASGTREPFYGAVFDPRHTDFYGWTIPKGGMLLFGAAFPETAGAQARFDEFAAGLEEHGVALGRELGRSSASIVRPRRLLDLLPGADGVLLAGEAAGFISPSSAEGISYALRSAASLARAADAGLVGAEHRYRAAVSPLALEIGLKAIKSAAVYTSLTRRLVMRAGIGTIGVVPGEQLRPVPQ